MMGWSTPKKRKDKEESLFIIPIGSYLAKYSSCLFHHKIYDSFLSSGVLLFNVVVVAAAVILSMSFSTGTSMAAKSMA